MKIEIALDDARVRVALNRLSRTAGDLSPAMRSIGEILLNSTRERFNSQDSPDGIPWAPLTETTLARKHRNRDKILTRDGYLRGQLVQRAGRDYVEIGSSRVYASTHQFGAAKGAFGSTGHGNPIPFGDIPARPFLGVSDEDGNIIQETLIDFIAEQWR